MVDERVCINNFCVCLLLLRLVFGWRVIKTRENIAGRPALTLGERAAELAYFFRENYQASLLAAAYRNGLSYFCVLELYFDVDWHGVALLFCFIFSRRSETERFDCADCEHLLFQTPVFSLGRSARPHSRQLLAPRNIA